MDDGVRIAVREWGLPTGPTVLCVHGFPDNSLVWEGVAAILGADHRVVAYDVRGAGASDHPHRTSAYRLDRLAADLAAVIGEVSPDSPVHLLAHDWGSIQAWYAIAHGQPVASYTSISGPDLDRASLWVRAQARRPRTWPRLIRQLFSSSYLLFFQVPYAAELVERVGLVRLVLRHRFERDDWRDGLKLYRANMFRRARRASPSAVRIPAQVLAPTRDPYCPPGMQAVDGVPTYEVKAGHWLALSRPDFIAAKVAELAAQAN